MSFERHVLQATRVAGLGRLARVDAVVERAFGARRSLAGWLNREFYVQPPYYRSNHRSVVGPEAEVRMPQGCQKFDYELEWGVFIALQGRDIPAERAAEISAATRSSTISRRVTSSSLRSQSAGPGEGQELRYRNAIGPCVLVTPEELSDPSSADDGARQR